MSRGVADHSHRCLVLGYDRTESSRYAASWAARELGPAGRLVIVHACRPLHAPPSPLTTAAERRHLGQALLDELFLEGEDAPLDIDLDTEISDADPATALLDAAQRHRAAAIVVGREQQSPLHTALGTVTSELLRSSPVPVTAVPAGTSD